MQLGLTTTRWHCCGLFDNEAKRKFNSPVLSITETTKKSYCNNEGDDILDNAVKAIFLLCTQDMDPEWYVGQMTRAEAEVSLRHVNKVSSTTPFLHQNCIKCGINKLL